MDPEKRLTCSDLLRLPYLAGVEATIPATTLQAQVSTGTSMLNCILLTVTASWTLKVRGMHVPNV